MLALATRSHAGDFGIYSVNHAVSAWTLLNLIEMFPEAFADGELDIAGGVGLSDAAEDWFVGLGLSVRWPE